MVVQHNLSASNANRMLNLTTANIAKSTEKLSSGYKINRAADDAAGLSISEKMRKQIRALNQASSNAQDGISMVQTAEGALNEVHDMLHRMNELAVKAANGTMSSSDRADVQAEVEELLTEIDRVSATTKFNELNLLDGDVKLGSSIADMRIKKGATANITAEMNEAQCDFILYSGSITIPTPGSTTIDVGGTSITIQYGTKSSFGISGKVNQGSDAAKYLQDPSNVNSGLKNNLKGLKSDIWQNSTYSGTPTSRTLQVTGGFYKEGDDRIQVFSNFSMNDNFPELNNYIDVTTGNLKSGVMYFSEATLSQANGSPATSLVNDRADVTNPGSVGNIYDANGNIVSMSDLKEDIERNANGDLVFKDSSYQTKYFLSKKQTALDNSGAVNQLTEAQLETLFDVYEAHHSLSVSLQVGADNLSNNRINVEIRHMNRVTLGLTGLDMSTVEGARQAIDLIGGSADGNTSGAIKECSKERSKLGAIQNRLEHTIRNLDNVVENTTAAESQIRDTDMAAEMVKFSKERILQQAGQSVLAQAQQSNQGVLALLG